MSANSSAAASPVSFAKKETGPRTPHQTLTERHLQPIKKRMKMHENLCFHHSMQCANTRPLTLFTAADALPTGGARGARLIQKYIGILLGSTVAIAAKMCVLQLNTAPPIPFPQTNTVSHAIGVLWGAVCYLAHPHLHHFFYSGFVVCPEITA